MPAYKALPRREKSNVDLVKKYICTFNTVYTRAHHRTIRECRGEASGVSVRDSHLSRKWPRGRSSADCETWSYLSFFLFIITDEKELIMLISNVIAYIYLFFSSIPLASSFRFLAQGILLTIACSFRWSEIRLQRERTLGFRKLRKDRVPWGSFHCLLFKLIVIYMYKAKHSTENGGERYGRVAYMYARWEIDRLNRLINNEPHTRTEVNKSSYLT